MERVEFEKQEIKLDVSEFLSTLRIALFKINDTFHNNDDQTAQNTVLVNLSEKVNTLC